MADIWEDARLRPSAPLPRRGGGSGGRRWAVAAGVGGCWVLLLVLTGSMLAATALLVLLAALAVAGLAGLRSLGVDVSCPWSGRPARRPWPDEYREQDEFPPGPQPHYLDQPHFLDQPDYQGLPGYRDQPGYPGRTGARPGPDPGSWAGPADSFRPVPPGPADGFRPVPAGQAGGTRPRQDGNAAAATVALAEAAGLGSPTVAELRRPAIPALRLVTGGSMSETRTSGACAGRGAVELALPPVPTVSREHARFTFAGGQWWIANLGRNGLTLNDVPLEGEQPLQAGDSIRWGRKPDALMSRVEIG